MTSKREFGPKREKEENSRSLRFEVFPDTDGVFTFSASSTAGFHDARLHDSRRAVQFAHLGNEREHFTIFVRQRKGTSSIQSRNHARCSLRYLRDSQSSPLRFLHRSQLTSVKIPSFEFAILSLLLRDSIEAAVMVS